MLWVVVISCREIKRDGEMSAETEAWEKWCEMAGATSWRRPLLGKTHFGPNVVWHENAITVTLSVMMLMWKYRCLTAVCIQGQTSHWKCFFFFLLIIQQNPIMTLVSECKNNICFMGCFIQVIHQGVCMGSDLINSQV